MTPIADQRIGRLFAPAETNRGEEKHRYVQQDKERRPNIVRLSLLFSERGFGDADGKLFSFRGRRQNFLFGGGFRRRRFLRDRFGQFHSELFFLPVEIFYFLPLYTLYFYSDFGGHFR